ncbi:hypothetical protein [Flavobacterium sharifuzzamanii]|uniref:hypothetical protein n=1 Tax=Flavobacterium sharifuzzamanii TaxID=2211133 RepID=UPI000DACD5B0|nr:hypothetical protein [Flavobacterium sharifuzzamanii]KAF2080119.1 hypothetical protein DMA14_17015 [Flavobacterium sharifuzzamanii]
MKGIDLREHRVLAVAFDKFEALSSAFPDVLEQSQENDVRAAMESLDGLHKKYQSLFHELQKCIEEYEHKKKTVRATINKANRKLACEPVKRTAV